MKTNIGNRAIRGEQGFTLIEVITALIIFMVGVMGMVALQGASIHAAVKSRQQTAAVGIARYILTQLKGEFAGWQRGETLPVSGFPMLNSVFTSTGNSIGNWVRFGNTPASGGDLRLDEFFGHSGLSDGGAARFCVNYAVNPLEVNLDDATPADYTVWLVRARVSWTKDGFFQTADIDWNVCDPDSVAARITAGADDVVELVSTATRELAR